MHGGHETAELRGVRRTGGGRGLRGGAGKRVDGVCPGRPQSFRYQRRLADDCSPGRGGMAQDGGRRGGTFHGEMDRCRESEGWTTACSSMPGCDGKGQGQDSHKWRELVSSIFLFVVCRCPVVTLFRFRIFASIEAAPLRPIVLRYACSPTATCSYLTTVCVLFRFCSLEMSLSPSVLYHYSSVSSLNGERVVRFFLLNGVFVPCDHGLDFKK